MNPSQCMVIDLNIHPDEYLRHYRGNVTQVVCRARDGRTVRFPSALLQRHVTHDGVHGTFRLEFDNNFKLIAFNRIDPSSSV